MSLLKKIGIVSQSQKQTKTSASFVFEQLYPDFRKVKYSSPSDYVIKYWDAFVEYKASNNIGSNNLNGKVFEYIIATVLINEKILPFYLEAKVVFVPNVSFDIILYSKEKGPICLSNKTSLRERYKQADLEAIALKYVHRKAESYLITIDEKEGKSVNNKIKKGDVIGLEKVIYSLGVEFDSLISSLKELEFIESPMFKAVDSNFLITRDKVLNAEI